MDRIYFRRIIRLYMLIILVVSSALANVHTQVLIDNEHWYINGKSTYPGSPAEGLLLNVRMVNAVFEDRGRPEFDADANTKKFIARIPDYVSHGVRAFTVNLQGGNPGYEGAINSAFNPDGSLRKGYLKRVRRVIEACDRNGTVVILGCYYQRQDQILKDAKAVRAGVVNVSRWIVESGFSNVIMEIANEYNHPGFDHTILNRPEGQVELIRLAKKTSPKLFVSTSGLGDGKLSDNVARASDFLLIHFNSTKMDDIPKRIQALKKYGKPIVCNEDQKYGAEAAEAAQLSVRYNASWGFMQNKINQYFPFHFRGIEDDVTVYKMLKTLTTPKNVEVYFPPPESKGGWRKLEDSDKIRQLAGMNPDKLDELKQWLLQSDKRNFAAVVIRNGYIALEVERGNSAKTDARRVASVSKAICATVLAIASEQSQEGKTPRKMSFEDPAFDFIPWAKPLSDPRKAKITVRQLLNHTSGICPEATGARNDGTWQYILGHSGNERTAKLAFDPGTACGYSTHALAHAALVCENITGKPYDEYAVEVLFKPIGCEHWWFQYYNGGEEIGRHPSHGMGMPARDLARIAYCMLHNGKWKDKQVIPKWFVEQTAAPTHDVRTQEMRWKLNPRTFSHGWELPANLTGDNTEGRSGEGIPHDARYKPGSGGQLIAFVPSLDLVITRQTGSSGNWQFAEYLRRACATVIGYKPETAFRWESEGFVRLFNNKSLQGWQGAVNDWTVENDQLVYKALVKPERSADLLTLKLMSERQYSDFILRFEFRLEPGANNGLAIRAPLKGDPAFVGMEIQIIDNDGWPNKLKPFQVHGSIYGIVPAKTGYLKPAGQWNEEEILCDGRHVRVILNGTSIVDANLDKVSPIDGQQHPGLRRNRGYIGLLGHTKSVAFRNIRIKELPSDVSHSDQ